MHKKILAIVIKVDFILMNISMMTFQFITKFQSLISWIKKFGYEIIVNL